MQGTKKANRRIFLKRTHRDSATDCISGSLVAYPYIGSMLDPKFLSCNQSFTVLGMFFGLLVFLVLLIFAGGLQKTVFSYHTKSRDESKSTRANRLGELGSHNEKLPVAGIFYGCSQLPKADLLTFWFLLFGLVLVMAPKG